MKVKRSGGLVLISMREFKELENLSQLDRIEFRQKYDDIGWNVDILPIAWYILIIGCIFGATGDIEAFHVFISFTIWVVIFHFLLMIVGRVITRNQKKKLFGEYFEVKPRGKNK